MPRTAHRVTDDDPFHQRSAVVRTVRPDGEELGARPRQHHLLVTHAPEDHAAVTQCRGGDPCRQVDRRALFRLAHGHLRAVRS